MTARRVLCFGDSNTHGTPPMADLGSLARFDAETRWPCVMGRQLGTDWIVIEEGQPGRTSVHDDPVAGEHKNGLRVLPALLETHRPIDLVVIMLGTNDLKTRVAVTPFDIAESVERLGQLVRASDAGPDGAAPEVMLISPAPILESGILAETFQGGAAKSELLASRMRKVARNRDWLFLDAARHVAVDPVEGVHLTAEAHGALGSAVAKVLSDRFD